MHLPSCLEDGLLLALLKLLMTGLKNLETIRNMFAQ